MSCPILRADCMQKFPILSNLNKSRLIDWLTGLPTNGDFITTKQSQIKLVSGNMIYKELFKDYPGKKTYSQFQWTN